jgi:hypothetical protein
MRFCKIYSKSKAPYEKEWQNKPLELKNIGENENAGVLTGYGNYVIIDIDDESIIEQLKTLINCDTFIVQSGSGNGYHLYYKVKDPDNITKNKFILYKDSVHVGEILWFGCQAVAAGSIHPSGNKYKVISDKDIRVISSDEIFKISETFKKEKSEVTLEYGEGNILQVRTSNILKTILLSF